MEETNFWLEIFKIVGQPILGCVGAWAIAYWTSNRSQKAFLKDMEQRGKEINKQNNNNKQIVENLSNQITNGLGKLRKRTLLEKEEELRKLGFIKLSEEYFSIDHFRDLHDSMLFLSPARVEELEGGVICMSTGLDAYVGKREENKCNHWKKFPGIKK